MRICFSRLLWLQICHATSLIALCALCTFAVRPALASGQDGGFGTNSFAPESFVVKADLPDFASGKLGVVPGSYWRIYLYLAYRAANGAALTKAQFASLNIEGSQPGLLRGLDSQGKPLDTTEGVRLWAAAKTAFQGKDQAALGTKKYDPARYITYDNCPNDALKRAALTLAERQKAGATPWVAVWLANQDVVFASCGLATHTVPGRPAPAAAPMPVALPTVAPDWLKHDFNYQSAAALFYAGKFLDARSRFQAIAKTAQSPWQPLGAYLAARCLLRQASLERGEPNPYNVEYTRAEDAKYRGLLETARAELVAAGKTYAPAQQLVSWVDARIHPERRLDELALALAGGNLNADTEQQLTDYLLLMDATDSVKGMAAASPLTAWIRAMQAPKAQRSAAMARARIELKKQPSALWLMPLLSHAAPGDLSADEISAASSIPPTAPTHVHLQFHLNRLVIVRSDAALADDGVNSMLDGPPGALSLATRSRWLGLKMLTAATREAFFKAALRPIADQTLRGVPIPDEKQPPLREQYDDDVLRQLARHFSVAELALARPAAKGQVPFDFVGIGWTRAAIFEDWDAADALNNELAAGKLTTAHLYERYKNARDKQAKQDAALLVLVNTPELHPGIVRPGIRGEAVWGCTNGSWAAGLLPDEGLDNAWPRFLPEPAMAQAKLEQTKLLALPKRSSYLGPLLLDYAQRQPDDKEVPKALHFYVASTRMECSDGVDKPKGVKSYSQQAFELLKQRYAKSEWARKSKYHF